MKILKYIFVCLWRIAFCFVIFFLIFLLAVPHANLMVKNIEQLLNDKLPQGMSLSGLSFSKIELSTAALSIHQIHFTLKKAESVYTVSAEGVFLSDMFCAASRTGCHLFIESINVENGDLKIEGAAGDFVISLKANERSAKGFVVIDSISYKEYTIANIYSDIDITDTIVMFDQASARAYQGWIKAEGEYQFLPKERIEITLDFKDIDTHTIHGVNSQWKGVVEGRAFYTGTFKRIDKVAIEFRSPSGEMERTLLKYLMGDINNSLVFLPFAKILEGADFIHLDNFQGTVHNLDQDSVFVKVNIDSKQLNLKLNPDITINLR